MRLETSRRTAVHPVTPLLLLAVALTGCRLPPPAATRYDAATAVQPPPCARAGKPMPVPATFPREFPFPARTAITFGFLLPGMVTVAGGFIASRDLGGTARFFEDYVPLSGFAAKPLATHSHREVDGLFWGHGHTGIWSVKALGPRCPGEIEVDVQTIPGVAPNGNTAGIRDVDPY